MIKKTRKSRNINKKQYAGYGTEKIIDDNKTSVNEINRELNENIDEDGIPSIAYLQRRLAALQEIIPEPLPRPFDAQNNIQNGGNKRKKTRKRKLFRKKKFSKFSSKKKY